MKYVSTRGRAPACSFTEAVEAGLAPDGGLYLPERLPQIGGQLGAWSRLSYADLAFEFLRLFATDLDPSVLRATLAQAYAPFEDKEIAPLRPLGPDLFVLELFHGPTLAFKDFALQWLGRLYGAQSRATGRPLNVVGATSGDTGAAAIHGMAGVPQSATFILYPDGRVSPLQERQMACTGAPNVHALAIEGTFDDAQALLKEILADREFRSRRRLAAVNSINLARVLAQCVYYLHAWFRLPDRIRSSAEFVVPTGNFGNVLAGWMLTRMGVAIGPFKVATNQNDILYRFFATGEYRVGAVHPSLAPSMDIQVASNFERFLSYGLKGDAERVSAAMAELKATGACRIEGVEKAFRASHCTDAQIPGIIRAVQREHSYLVDPHTACGFAGVTPGTPSVVLATAHPAKFPETIKAAIGIEPTHPSLEALKARPVIKHRLKADLSVIRAFIAAHAV